MYFYTNADESPHPKIAVIAKNDLGSKNEKKYSMKKE